MEVDGIKIAHWSTEEDTEQTRQLKLRLLWRFSAIVGGGMSLFALAKFIQDDYLLGALLLLTGSVISLNAIGVRYLKFKGIHYSFIYSLLTATLLFMVYSVGSDGVYWIYPMIAGFVFTLERKPGLLFSAALVLGTTTIATLEFTPITALRIFVSSFLTALVVGYFLNELQRVHDSLEDSSLLDQLTGVFNRKRLNRDLDKALSDKAKSGTASTLLLIDLDHFKEVNDIHGHSVGDEVLRHIARRIKEEMPNGARLFRLGGDEFLILLNCAVTRDGEIFGTKLLQICPDDRLIEAHGVTFSIGVAEVESHTNASDWLRAADQAMYHAKRTGKNRMSTHPPEPLDDAPVA